MTRAEILNCLTDRPCDYCKFHESGRCERWECVFEEKPDDAEESRETDDYENEIADLQNRLDIAEYDKDRWKEKVTVLEEKLKSLSAEPCEDAISREEVLKAFVELPHEYKTTEQRARTGGIAACQAIVSDLPSVTPKQKVGHWIYYQKNIWIYAQCSECGTVHDTKTNYCPNCGAKMEEGENG